MAALTCTGRELLELLSEHVGYKSGLALTRPELVEHLEEDAKVLPPSDDQMLRIRHEEVDAMARQLLYRVGTLKSPSTLMPSLVLYAKYHKDPALFAIYQCIIDEFNQATKRSALTNPGQPIDITSVPVRAAKEFGAAGFEMWNEFYELTEEWMQGSLMSGFRRVAWENTEQLTSLFESEKLDAAQGTFLDQRFVDYLAQNFEAVDAMNWRKFEGLVAEYFDKRGYAVDLGPGRGDDGVDIRVWKQLPTPGDPPTLLVQCKRQQDKIGKTVVKALWADLVNEDVQTGLIVTSHALEPGAAKKADALADARVARGYRVGRVERQKLRKWIESMRTPGRGLFVP
jgi:restriction system protein